MNWTKFILATLIGGIAYFLLGWGVYGVLLKDAIAIPAEFKGTVEYPEDQFKISLMFASCLVWAALFAFIFMRWANISTFVGGLKAGALLGALITSSSLLGLAAQFRIWTVSSIPMELVANVICSGLMAGLIGWFIGRNK